MQAYVEGLRWGVDPKNRAEATKLYVEALKLNEAMAARTLAIAAHPTDGLTRDARLDLDGFKNVLSLRATVMKQWAGNAAGAREISRRLVLHQGARGTVINPTGHGQGLLSLNSSVFSTPLIEKSL